MNKANMKEGDNELEVNVGYGFMFSHLLKLQGVPLGKGSEIHPNAYLFKPFKKSKSTIYETSIRYSAPLQVLLEKKKKRKIVKKATTPALVNVPFEEHSGSNEPPVKRTKTIDEVSPAANVIVVDAPHAPAT